MRRFDGRMIEQEAGPEGCRCPCRKEQGRGSRRSAARLVDMVGADGREENPSNGSSPWRAAPDTMQETNEWTEETSLRMGKDSPTAPPHVKGHGETGGRRDADDKDQIRKKAPCPCQQSQHAPDRSRTEVGAQAKAFPASPDQVMTRRRVRDIRRGVCREYGNGFSGR